MSIWAVSLLILAVLISQTSPFLISPNIDYVWLKSTAQSGAPGPLHLDIADGVLYGAEGEAPQVALVRQTLANGGSTAPQQVTAVSFAVVALGTSQDTLFALTDTAGVLSIPKSGEGNITCVLPSTCLPLSSMSVTQYGGMVVVRSSNEVVYGAAAGGSVSLRRLAVGGGGPPTIDWLSLGSGGDELLPRAMVIDESAQAIFFVANTTIHRVGSDAAAGSAGVVAELDLIFDQLSSIAIDVSRQSLYVVGPPFRSVLRTGYGLQRAVRSTLSTALNCVSMAGGTDELYFHCRAQATQYADRREVTQAGDIVTSSTQGVSGTTVAAGTAASTTTRNVLVIERTPAPPIEPNQSKRRGSNSAVSTATIVAISLSLFICCLIVGVLVYFVCRLSGTSTRSRRATRRQSGIVLGPQRSARYAARPSSARSAIYTPAAHVSNAYDNTPMLYPNTAMINNAYVAAPAKQPTAYANLAQATGIPRYGNVPPFNDEAVPAATYVDIQGAPSQFGQSTTVYKDLSRYKTTYQNLN